jgi:hypothetical protein
MGRAGLLNQRVKAVYWAIKFNVFILESHPRGSSSQPRDSLSKTEPRVPTLLPLVLDGRRIFEPPGKVMRYALISNTITISEHPRQS